MVKHLSFVLNLEFLDWAIWKNYFS